MIRSLLPLKSFSFAALLFCSRAQAIASPAKPVMQGPASGVNLDWNTCGSTATLATSSTGTATYVFGPSDCIANGFTCITEATGTSGTSLARVLIGVLAGVKVLRMDRNPAGATFTKGHFKSTAGDLFKLTNINIFSTSPSAQTITITAYKAGVMVSGSTISISTTSTAAHNLTTADFGSHYNAIDEIVLTASLGFGVGISNVQTAAALPVTWLNFDVHQDAGIVDWRWTLAMEENVAYYTPQYSRNGIDFTDAGKITDLNQDHIYSYRMPLAFSGNIFFRVLEVDLDGKTDYSIIRSLKSGSSAPFTFYPNPASSGLYLQWPYADAGSLAAVIIDNKGMTVSRQTMPIASPVKIPLTGLASGTYYIYCTDDKQRRSTAIPFVKIPE